MPIRKHKGYANLLRGDSPHGYSKPTPPPAKRPASDYVTPQPEQSEKPAKIQIGTTPDTSARPALSKKEQKRKDKAMKDINNPKRRAESAKRGEMYNRAKKDEDARIDNPMQSTAKDPTSSGAKFKARGGVAQAYAEGGFEGMDKYDEAKYGKNDTTSQWQKTRDDAALRNEESSKFR